MALDDRDIYTDKHWEILIETIIDRIGIERMLGMLTYVLNERRDARPRLKERMAALEKRE